MFLMVLPMPPESPHGKPWGVHTFAVGIRFENAGVDGHQAKCQSERESGPDRTPWIQHHRKSPLRTGKSKLMLALFQYQIL
jgi:hypothetical protein